MRVGEPARGDQGQVTVAADPGGDGAGGGDPGSDGAKTSISTCATSVVSVSPLCPTAPSLPSLQGFSFPSASPLPPPAPDRNLLAASCRLGVSEQRGSATSNGITKK